MPAAAPTSVAPAARDDILTVLALGVLAAVLSTVAHEAMGHGGVCLAIGGRITKLTSVYFHCAPQTTWVTAGGPLGNLMAALVAWLARQVLPARWLRARLVLILVTAFSLFWEAGYVLHAMVKQDGDWWFVARDLLGASLPVRIGGGVLGVVLYGIGVVATARAMRPFETAAGRAGLILGLAWFAGAIAEIAAAFAYTADRDAIRQAALEIGAASLPLWLLARRLPVVTAGVERIGRGWLWIAGAAVVYAAFVMTMGRGLP